MDSIMIGLLVIFLPVVAFIGVMALRSRVMLKLGLRNIPRRRAQTVLIIVGIMISTLIMAAAFGTGDTITFSIRKAAVDGLGTIDEIIVNADVNGLVRRVKGEDIEDWRSHVAYSFVPRGHLVGRAFAVFWPIYAPPAYTGPTRIKLIR